jgi:hypothetical protein
VQRRRAPSRRASLDPVASPPSLISCPPASPCALSLSSIRSPHPPFYVWPCHPPRPLRLVLALASTSSLRILPLPRAPLPLPFGPQSPKAALSSRRGPGASVPSTTIVRIKLPPGPPTSNPSRPSSSLNSTSTTSTTTNRRRAHATRTYSASKACSLRRHRVAMSVRSATVGSAAARTKTPWSVYAPSMLATRR